MLATNILFIPVPIFFFCIRGYYVCPYQWQLILIISGFINVCPYLVWQLFFSKSVIINFVNIRSNQFLSISVRISISVSTTIERETAHRLFHILKIMCILVKKKVVDIYHIWTVSVLIRLFFLGFKMFSLMSPFWE